MNCVTVAILTSLLQPPVTAPRPEIDTVRPPVVCPRPTPWWAGEAQLAIWVDQLSAESYADRQEATRLLATQPARVIDHLLDAVERVPLEARYRILSLLDAFHASGESLKTDRAEAALRTLVDSDDAQLAASAEEILARNASISEARATVEIRRFGGVIHTAETARRLMPVPGPNGVLVYPSIPPNAVTRVVLGNGWNGGDGEVQQIARLPHVTEAYIVEGSDVSDEAEAWLVRAKPQIQIQHRGTAFLGIGMEEAGRGCRIVSVSPKSAADRAGLRIGDLLLSLNGKATPTPQICIDLIANHKPGDVVELRLQRNFQAMTVRVRLGTWEGRK